MVAGSSNRWYAWSLARTGPCRDRPVRQLVISWQEMMAYMGMSLSVCCLSGIVNRMALRVPDVGLRFR